MIKVATALAVLLKLLPRIATQSNTAKDHAVFSKFAVSCN